MPCRYAIVRFLATFAIYNLDIYAFFIENYLHFSDFALKVYLHVRQISH